MTDTTCPNNVQPFIDKNIRKKGYEKAVKEFMDEKRKVIQKQAKMSAVPVRSSNRLRERMPEEQTQPTTHHQARLLANEPQSNSRSEMQLRSTSRQIHAHELNLNSRSVEPVRSSNRIRNRMTTETPTKSKQSEPIQPRLPTDNSKPNSRSVVPLRRSSRLQLIAQTR